jgi:Fe-S cluster assembly ATP-binding protein
MLELKNVSFDVKSEDVQKEIIKDISLNIGENKLVVITGPNGGGKSTMAKLIAGIEKATAGKIYFDGQDITDLSITERANLGISFAFQQPVRFKGITVKRLIELASGNKMNDGELCDILSKVGLCAREYINREVDSTLSGGEIKRIEIATVLARQTQITIFDEPEAGIDLWSFSSLIKVFSEMRRNLKGTLIIISHQERILNIADEIAVVADGRIKAKGAADEMMKTLMNSNEISNVCSKQEVLL